MGKYVYQVAKGKENIIFRKLIELIENNGPFRQQNKLDINFAKFPNDEIQNSQEFVKIVKKLFWSCSPNITRYKLGIQFEQTN